MISLVCPGCKQPLDVGDETATCPRCGHALSPSVSPATVAIEMRASPPPLFPLRSNHSYPKDQVVTRIAGGGQTAADLSSLPPLGPAPGIDEKTMSWPDTGEARVRLRSETSAGTVGAHGLSGPSAKGR